MRQHTQPCQGSVALSNFICHFLRVVAVILEFGTTPVVPQIRKWLRGVDLNPGPALIPRKLLIPRYAKTAQPAKKANLSYTFFTLRLRGELPGFRAAIDSSPFHAIVGAHHFGLAFP
jgi:hypothetical protein